MAAMPDELPHACHNCASLGYLIADGAHAWCKRHRQTIATPATGCAYWLAGKNAASIHVPGHNTMQSTDFDRIRGT